MTSMENPLHKILKNHREQKRFSLHSIHQETRVPVIYLEAMEAGNWKAFPAEVYLIGFLQKYAKYLGLNPAEMVQIYRKEQEAQNTVKQEEVKKVEQVVHHEQNDALVKGIVFTALILLVGSWWLYTVLESSKKKEKAEPRAKAADSNPALPTHAGIPSDPSKLALDVRAKESVWIRIVSDQSLQFEGFLTPGTTRQYVAAEGFTLRIGNVNALELALNGRPVNPGIGSVQSVGELRFTHQSLSDESIFLKPALPSGSTTESRRSLDAPRIHARAPEAASTPAAAQASARPDNREEN